MSDQPHYDFKAIFKRRSPYFPEEILPLRSGFRAFLQINEIISVPCVTDFDFPRDIWPNMFCDAYCALATPHKFPGSLSLFEEYNICLGFRKIGLMTPYEILNPILEADAGSAAGAPPA